MTGADREAGTAESLTADQDTMLKSRLAASFMLGDMTISGSLVAPSSENCGISCSCDPRAHR
jgi:hypothetical protein